jgi:hypothetical protein
MAAKSADDLPIDSSSRETMPHRRRSAKGTATAKTKTSYDRPHPAIQEIRRILDDRARQRDLISYSDLVSRVRSVRLIARSKFLADVLTVISSEEYAAGRGLLSAVVVQKTRHGLGIPGNGFFSRLAPVSGCAKENWSKCWKRELHKVFQYWQRRLRSDR